MRRILICGGIPDGDAALAFAAAEPAPVRIPQTRNVPRPPGVLSRGTDLPFPVPAPKEAS